MTEREKVIKGLENVWDAFNQMDHELYADYVYDALALLKAQKSGWISVDERLPERGILILTATYGTDIIMQQEGETREEAIERSRHGKGRVDTGFIDRDGYWCSGDGFPSVIQPSYWMPLPEPPKEET